MSGNRYIAVFLSLLLTVVFLGWKLDDPPAEDYQYPIDGYYALSGTFGELRPNHFHSGLDIKTGGRIGVPIQAIADGYIYRIKVSPFGYGNAIYLRHKDGRYSVYAHLSRFTEEVADYVYEKQWENEQFAQELFPDPATFKVAKGELVGFSGNSGSSQGPHLHFEIRDPQHRIINPLPYYFENIPDRRPPNILHMALVPLSPHSRIDGVYERKIFELLRTRDGYRLREDIEVVGPVGLQYRAYDLLDGTRNWCGINKAELYLDDDKIFDFSLDRFAFDENRFINLHLDYPHYKAFKRSFEKAYVDKGNALNAYDQIPPQGVIEIMDEDLHSFRLRLQDAHGNNSFLSGRLKGGPTSEADLPFTYKGEKSIRYEIDEQVLKLIVRRPEQHHLEGVWVENQFGDQHLWKPAYRKGIEMVYIMEIDPYHFPRKVQDQEGELQIEFPHIAAVYPEQSQLIEQENVQLFFPSNSVFRETYLPLIAQEGTKEMLGKQFQIGDDDYPLFRSCMISMMPPAYNGKGKTVIMRKDKDEWNFVGSRADASGRVYGSTNDLGTFCVMIDSIPPIIRPVNFSNRRRISSRQNTLQLEVKDEFTGINSRSIMGSLDGAWILFEYDAKRDRIIHRFRQRPEAGEHTLTIETEDLAGNRQELQFELRF